MSDTIPGGAPGSNGIINSGYILPNAPFVNPKTGVITPVWWRFLISLLARTGGPAGIPTADVQIIAALAGVEEDARADLDGLLAAAQQGESDFAEALADQLAIALAAQTVMPEAVADDAPPFVDADPVPQDDTLATLAATYEELIAPDEMLAALVMPPDPVAIADGWTWGVGATGVVVADTYTLCGFASFAGSITALRAVVGPAAVGALTETVKINGAAVTGINGVNVNAATVQTFAATAACNFIAGDLIQLTVAIGSGIPVGAWSTIQYVKAPQ